MIRTIFIIGLSFIAQFANAQEYTLVNDLELINEIELEYFWGKIEGEMNPRSIWGEAKTDQEKCQAEADYMARYNKLCHVGPCIGRFEGIGWSKTCPKPNTCVPRYKMKLTGDATATCENGRIIRVRSWR